jgi:hypothetical protein
MIEPTGRGVLDHPHARVMTIVASGKTASLLSAHLSTTTSLICMTGAASV